MVDHGRRRRLLHRSSEDSLERHGFSDIAGSRTPRSANDRRQGSSSLVEVFIKGDPAAHQTSETIKRVRFELEGVDASLGGVAPEDRDFASAVYSTFPYVVALVVLLTFFLLARAFRSLLLALKAVILNLISLVAAYGVIVLVFQKGYGSDLLWGIHATDAVIPWIPLMIFAFLYGLSMDYEVFMLTRMREAYDETHDNEQAIALGLARTGKLVTSAALILSSRSSCSRSRRDST